VNGSFTLTLAASDGVGVVKGTYSGEAIVSEQRRADSHTGASDNGNQRRRIDDYRH
jgi:hypothetical protein